MTPSVTTRSAAADIAGVRIHHRIAGPDDGPVMLLIHGWPQTGIAWRRMVVPLTAAGFRVVMPDLRGAGGSSRPREGYDKATDLAGLLDHLGTSGPVTVVGHDIGAIVACAFARRHADRTARLAVLESVIPGTAMFDDMAAHDPSVWHFHFHQALDVPEALTQGREALYLERFWHDSAHDPDAIDAEAAGIYLRHFRQPGAMRAGFALYRSFSQDAADHRRWLEDQGPLAMPVLAVAGAHGRYAEQVSALVGEFATDVSTAVVPEAGHWLAEEAPDALADTLVSFAAVRG
jgi:pimeloyl-ACP methyl ester carboxylesterase